MPPARAIQAAEPALNERSLRAAFGAVAQAFPSRRSHHGDRTDMTNIKKNDAALASALARVAAQGIAVRRVIGDPATGTYAAMVRAELAARCPAGMGSYVLWSASGDAYALHCSDAGVAEVVAAACHATGVTTHRDGAVVTARATAPSRRAAGKASPWRWLGARRTPSPAPVPD
jgi:hypothetical protein